MQASQGAAESRTAERQANPAGTILDFDTIIHSYRSQFGNAWARRERASAFVGKSLSGTRKLYGTHTQFVVVGPSGIAGSGGEPISVRLDW